MKQPDKDDNDQDRLGKSELSLISSITPMLNFTVHLNIWLWIKLFHFSKEELFSNNISGAYKLLWKRQFFTGKKIILCYLVMYVLLGNLTRMTYHN
jgi:hypothetical protein